MKHGLLFALIIATLAAASLAETRGQINLSTSNVSIVTGLFGYTVDYCNANYECFDYACFLDWDSTGGGGKAGWCNLSSITNCYHNGTSTSTGTSACDTSTSYRTCTSGTWGASTACSSNNTCTSGSCSTSSSSSSSSSSGGGSSLSTTTNFNQAVKILSSVPDINITQGQKALKTIAVKNIGNRTLFNVTLGISGIDTSWVSIGPNKVNITVGANATFGLEFVIPLNGTSKIYDVTAEVSTSNSSVKSSIAFKLYVNPTEETVQKEILPSYNDVSVRLTELDNKIKALEETCTETKVLRTNSDDIKSKLTDIEKSIQDKNYAKANTVIEEAKTALDELNQKILNTTPSTCKGVEIPVLYIAIGAAVVGVIGIMAYLFWPQKAEPGYHPEKGWVHPKQKPPKKKKRDDEFLYDFRRKNK